MRTRITIRSQRPASSGSAIDRILAEKLRPEREPEPDPDEGGDLEVAAQDLIDAVKRNDVRAVADALSAAFDICASAPEPEPE